MRRTCRALGSSILIAGALAAAACSGGGGTSAAEPPKAKPAAEQQKIPVGDAGRRMYFEAQCRAGRAGLCGELAQMWERGWGGPKDKKKADEYYKMACDQAVVESCTALGIDLKPERELEILDKNCAAGSAFACNNQGQLLFNGFDTLKPDQAKALPILEKGCAGGYAPSCRTLAQVYGMGVGVGKDEAKAKAYHEKAQAADAAMRAIEAKYLGMLPHDELPIGRTSSFTLGLENGNKQQDEANRAALEKAARDAEKIAPKVPETPAQKP